MLRLTSTEPKAMAQRVAYPMGRAQDLVAAILSATSPEQISAACSAVDSFLRRHSADQPRAFFSSAFPALLCRLFGFDDSSSAPSSSSPRSWLDVAAADSTLAARLLALLSPSGALLASIAAADRHALVKYVFPPERLPEWMRFALQGLSRPSTVLPDLCPLFKSRIKEDPVRGSLQLQLNVYEYYVLWFAYYPVCRGNSETANSGTIRKNRRFRLENWTSSLPGLASAGRRPGHKMEINLYLRLLYAYLRAFVPKCGLGSYQPYRSSLLHYSSSYDGSAFMQAEFFVYTLVHFWMVDNDFSPLPVNVCRSFGISFPFRAVLGETPPTPGLGEVLTLVVKYLNCSLIAPTEEKDHKLSVGSPVWKYSGSLDVDKSRNVVLSFENWNAVMQRPLYRFVLRTFLFCPMGTSMKNVVQVFSLWLAYMAPWMTSPEDLAEYDAPLESFRMESQVKSNEAKGESRVEPTYTPAWQSYVLSNYLLYNSLVMHFLGFAHKFLHANVEAVTQMVSKVLSILTSSNELMDLLRKVEAAYYSKHVGPSTSSLDNVYKYIPSIREQVQDWEDGLCESDADGSFLHDHWNGDLKLFSNGEEGAQNLFQLFVLRAEHVIQTISGDISQNLRALDTIRAQMNVLFDGPLSRSHWPISSEEAPAVQGRGEVFTPKHPGVGKCTWADVRYKGDWMRRPISGDEVACLARLLIRLSDWLNEALALDRVCEDEPRCPIFVVMNHDEPDSVGGPKEAITMVAAHVVSWLGLLGQALLRLMRSHGMRINLRMLASKKFVMVVVVYAVFYALKKASGL